MTHEQGIRFKVVEPDGRTVVLKDEQWQHVLRHHQDMARYERAVAETITHPLHREADERPGRERYFAERKGPSRWLRVVVDFRESPAFVVTAFGQDNEP